jgi:hypothetical protein
MVRRVSLRGLTKRSRLREVGMLWVMWNVWMIGVMRLIITHQFPELVQIVCISCAHLG